jgi:hypothetical protein
MAYFELQSAESDLQQLAEQYWQEAGEREQQLEKAAFEAGAAIRGGEYTLPTWRRSFAGSRNGWFIT